MFPTTARAVTNFVGPNTPNIGNPAPLYTTFIYAAAAGATVFEYTANREYPPVRSVLENGHTYVVLENAFVDPLKTTLLPDHAPDPTTLLEFPDLSFHR
jgi:hypothetical protein